MRPHHSRTAGFPISGLLVAAALAVATLAPAQTVPPPATSAARPPTERTLQPVDASQTRERSMPARDCKRDAAELHAQYRIQQESVTTQYDAKLAQAADADRAPLKAERDAKIAELQAQGDDAAKKLRKICQTENAATPRPNETEAQSKAP